MTADGAGTARHRRRVFWIALQVTAAVLAAGLFWGLSRPTPEPFADRVMTPGDAVPPPGAAVRVRYFSISTLVISDGETALMTDGYFTRFSNPLDPFLNPLITPDRAAIAAGLERAGIDSLAAVLVGHSHFDHAMDAPIVAARTGAVLVGSASTANVGRGLDLPEAQIRVAEPGVAMRFGRFDVTFIRSAHVPLPFGLGGLGETIDAPLVPPARVWDYKEGGTYAMLIEHPAGRLLIHGSAGFVPGMYRDIRADVVLLGTGGLGFHSDAYQRAYLDAVVTATQPRLVLPINFEDLYAGAGPPRLPPRLAGGFARTMALLDAQVGATTAVRLLPYEQPVTVLGGRAGRP